jgi:signal transduction histidine kinase
MENELRSILLVEDNPDDVVIFRETLAGWRRTNPDGGVPELTHAGSVRDALASIADRRFDVVALDLGLPDASGLEALRRLREACSEVPIVILSGFADEPTALEAIRSGAQDYLPKDSITTSLLRRSLRYAIERKKAELAQRRREKDLSNVLEASSDGVVIVDEKGVILFVNSAASALLGRSVEGLLGEPLDPALLSGGPAEIRRVAGDFSTIQVEVRINEVDWQSHRSRLLLVRDITERKQQEEMIRKAEQAEALSTLMAGMAHNMNNPLAAASGMAQLMILDETLSEEHRKELQQLIEMLTRIADFENSLLNASRFELMPYSYSKGSEVLRKVLSYFKGMAAKKQVFVKHAIDTDGEVKLGPVELEQIAVSVLQNAVDASAEGSTVSIATSLEDNWYVITIADHGRGIPAQALPKIFDPFFTTKEGAAARGLGLAIVKRIIDRCEGRITVQSEVGKGTTVKMFIPLMGK